MGRTRTRARTRGATAAPLPPWLSGEAVCPFCLQLYALEMEVRCPECDRGVCPCCVVVREAAALACPQCPDEDVVGGAGAEAS